MLPDNNTICCRSWREPKVILALIGILLLAGIITVSILRDRIVNVPQWQVTVNGEGKVSYQSDIAVVLLGVQIDKAATAETALSSLNQRTEKIVAAVKKAGIDEADINTQGFSVYTHYDLVNSVSEPNGYDASQQLAIKARDIVSKKTLVAEVIKAATEAGANRVDGITFDVSNLEALKQQARIKAIADAKSKAAGLAQAAGVRLRKVVGWWENIIQAPGVNQPTYYSDGKGGMGGGGSVFGVPNGLQEIIIDVSVNYQIR